MISVNNKSKRQSSVPVVQTRLEAISSETLSEHESISSFRSDLSDEPGFSFTHLKKEKSTRTLI